MNALVLCALVGAPEVLLKPGAVQRTCEGTCDRKVWVSQATLSLGTHTLMCNDCGRAALIAQRQVDPRPLPLRYVGLNDPTPNDRRRRNELEARGFTKATPEEIEVLRADAGPA